MWREAAYYTGMARGVWQYLSSPPLADPLGELRARVAAREDSFLDLARRVVYANPDHPFHSLLAVAGCAYADLERAVRQDGLEAALQQLCSAGVYLTQDEFKGQTPLVRGGREIACGPERLTNPLITGLMETRSSGSRSPGTPTRKGTAFHVYREAHDQLILDAWHMGGAEWVQVRALLPSTAGLNGAFRAARRGNPVKRWFAAMGSWTDTGHYRSVTAAMVRLARLRGYAVPLPEPLPPNDFAPVARYVAGRKQAGVRCVVSAFASPAVRVAAAAVDEGLDIAGTLFLSGGEPSTAAKRQVVARAGAQWCVVYHIAEVGPIGYSCPELEGNSVHLLRDSLAVITRRREAPLAAGPVNSLAFTTVLPFAARFLINTEMDDSGTLRTATCQCSFAACGLHTVMENIASYGKLTGQGMTLVGTDVVRILEECLPARFGGGPGDFQLVEREGPGQTVVELRVSPRAGRAACSEIRSYFLAQLKKQYGGSLAARTWQHSGAVRVVREEPLTTRTGKVLPLHLLDPEGPHAS
jgi:hypothetical protein